MQTTADYDTATEAEHLAQRHTPAVILKVLLRRQERLLEFYRLKAPPCIVDRERKLVSVAKMALRIASA